MVRDFGFLVLCVCYYGIFGCFEIVADDLLWVFECEDEIVWWFKVVGYSYVVIDCELFCFGWFNEVRVRFVAVL